MPPTNDSTNPTTCGPHHVKLTAEPLWSPMFILRSLSAVLPQPKPSRDIDQRTVAAAMSMLLHVDQVALGLYDVTSV